MDIEKHAACRRRRPPRPPRHRRARPSAGRPTAAQDQGGGGEEGRAAGKECPLRSEGPSVSATGFRVARARSRSPWPSSSPPCRRRRRRAGTAPRAGSSRAATRRPRPGARRPRGARALAPLRRCESRRLIGLRMQLVQTRRATGGEPGARIVYLSGSGDRYPVWGSLSGPGKRVGVGQRSEHPVRRGADDSDGGVSPTHRGRARSARRSRASRTSWSRSVRAGRLR